jgi:hypothetical protein
MRHSAESIFVVEYLRKYESTFEKAPAWELGDPGILFAETTENRKSRDTVLLGNFIAHDFRYTYFLWYKYCFGGRCALVQSD